MMLSSEDSSLPLNGFYQTQQQEFNVNQTDAAYGITTDSTTRVNEKARFEHELNGYLIPQSVRKGMQAYLDSSSACDSSNEVMDTTQAIMSQQKQLQSPRNAHKFTKLSMGSVQNNTKIMGFR